MRETQVPFPPYDFYSTEQLLEAFCQGPARVRLAVEGLSLEEVRARPLPGKWSILEIVLHLLDSELIGAVRVRLAVAQPGSQLPGYNQDIWTATLQHNESDASRLEDTLQLFALHRRVTVGIFENVPDKGWTDYHGTHPDYGRVSLRNLLELYADHSERHIEQILERRSRIRRPLVMPSLLSRRLY